MINTKENLYAAVISRGANKISFNFSYDNRNNVAMIKELGKAIANLCYVIPNGVLLIFSSYQLLNTIRNIWYEEDDTN